MSDPLRLSCSTSNDIPPVERLRQLATSDRHVVLHFPPSFTGDQKRSIVTELRTALANWSVFDSGGSQSTECVTIKKVIDRERVIEYAQHIIDAARDFRRTANALSQELAEQKRIRPSELLDHRDRGGKLKTGWKYHFHGLQCRFESKKTKQIVEVEIAFGNEFGVLDPFFFGLFVESTPQFRWLADLFPDLYHDTARALDVLEELGRLERVSSAGTFPKTGVVAQ
jgi:hypothetical protein